jgi:hypothetical protein
MQRGADTCLADGFARIRTKEFIPIVAGTPLTCQPNGAGKYVNQVIARELFVPDRSLTDVRRHS